MPETTPPQAQRRFPPRVIIYREGRFLCWSTANLRPLFYNRDPGDFHKTLTSDGGPYSGAYVSARMRAAMQYGSSVGPSIAPEEIVHGNHLGPNGGELTLEQIFATYVQEGLSPNLDMQFGTIEVTPQAHAKFQRWRQSHLEREIQQHKEEMRKLGFPFPEPDTTQKP